MAAPDTTSVQHSASASASTYIVDMGTFVYNTSWHY